MNELKLSENLVRLRREKNVTQEALAAFVGVTMGAVSKWENGTTLPDVATLPLLASFFDVTVDEILGYTPQFSSDEIGELTRSFNYMAHRLKNTVGEVQGERDKLNTLFLHMTDGVAAFTTDGTLIHMNPATENLLAAKGFSEAVVTILSDSVDVVVNADDLTESQIAQIEDIVKRKTECSADKIVISPVGKKK